VKIVLVIINPHDDDDQRVARNAEKQSARCSRENSAPIKDSV